VAKNIFSWVYKKRVEDFSGMTNVARNIRNELSSRYSFSTFDIIKVEHSKDDCVKFLFRLPDMNTIESVVIPHDDRITLCVSTQVGCKMGCAFCCTAKQGFQRSLNAWEIVEQVQIVNDYLRDKLSYKTDDSGIRAISNIVYMGMGEPLDNISNVVRSVDILSDDNGLGFGKRKITVSTCGLVPQMLEFKKICSAKLALSLNAANNNLRDRLMPINKKYDLNKVLSAIRQIPLKKFEFITIEYIMFRNMNDSVHDAKELAECLKDLPVKVNLIPFNEHEESLAFKTPADKALYDFYDCLVRNGLVCNVRSSRGSDISAACGQLRSRNFK
jgi:23S rRNA (adenine2503-C2)-methyltransferase